MSLFTSPDFDVDFICNSVVVFFASDLFFILFSDSKILSRNIDDLRQVSRYTCDRIVHYFINSVPNE